MVYVAGPLMRQQIVFNICGTVVCSADVFYIHLRNRLSQWGAHKRNITVIIWDKTGGFFYDNQTGTNKPAYFADGQ